MDDTRKPIDERIIIDTNADNTIAYATFSEPLYEGKKLKRDEILEQINLSGIIYGLDESAIRKLSQIEIKYGKKYEIAYGDDGLNGTDGRIEFLFNTKTKSHAPKLTEDGTVDYKNLELIENAHQGEVLVRVVEPTEGKSGTSVFGEAIQKNPGKPAPRLPKGKNTEVSADGKELVAMVNGQIIFLNSSVSVSEILEIRGNVDNSTGNINFNGSVIIHGNVITGFKVVANGNVDVDGFVEGGEIISKGSIRVKKEIIGMNKSYIECMGSLTCMLIKNATAYVAGDLYADGVMHSNVKCDGKVLLRGKKGVLVGGSMASKGEIDACIIGSPMATNTDIKVGMDVEVYEKYKTGMEELIGLNKRFGELSTIISNMSKFKDINSVSSARKQSYMKTVQEAKSLKEKIESLHREVYTIKVDLEKQKHNGRIYARNIMYPGVNLQIGNALINIRDNIHTIMALNSEGKIKLVTLV